MNTITCQDCGQNIRRAHAHIRSVSFVQVGWCRPCWVARNDVTVPTPRVPTIVPSHPTTVGARA